MKHLREVKRFVDLVHNGLVDDFDLEIDKISRRYKKIRKLKGKKMDIFIVKNLDRDIDSVEDFDVERKLLKQSSEVEVLENEDIKSLVLKAWETQEHNYIKELSEKLGNKYGSYVVEDKNVKSTCLIHVFRREQFFVEFENENKLTRKEYFRNGKVRNVSEKINDILIKDAQFYENGKLEYDLTLNKEGVRHGETKYFHESGNLECVRVFEDGKITEERWKSKTIFYKNGSVDRVKEWEGEKRVKFDDRVF